MTSVNQVVQLLFTGKDQGVSQALNKIGTASKATATAAAFLNRAFTTALAFGIAKLSGDFLIQLGKSVDTTGEFTEALDGVQKSVSDIVRDLLPDMSKVLREIAKFIAANQSIIVGVFRALVVVVQKVVSGLNQVLFKLGLIKLTGIENLRNEIDRELSLQEAFEANLRNARTVTGVEGGGLVEHYESLIRLSKARVAEMRKELKAEEEVAAAMQGRSQQSLPSGGDDDGTDPEQALSFIERLRAALAAASDVSGQSIQLIVSSVRRVSSAIGDAIDRARSWEQAFAEVGRSIVKQLRDIYIEYVLIQAVQAALGGGSGASVTGGRAGVSTSGSGGGLVTTGASGSGVRLIQQVTIQAVDAKSVQRLFAENSRALADVQTASLQRYSGLRLSTRRA